MSSQPQTAAQQILAERYTLTSVKRAGGQAVVYKALDAVSAELVAVKRVAFGPDDRRAKEGFQREAQFLQDLTHDNIVRLIDVGQDGDGNWFLVLEWIDDNLEDVIRREGPLPWPIFWDRFGRSLLDAIVYGQQRKVAHRDIKPRNILITPTGVPKLADYGIGKLIDNGGSWKPVAGVTFRFDRTAGYSPAKPEDERYGYSRDCFGFAAVAISCVAGRVITDDTDLKVALEEAALPDVVRDLLERCLSDDPAERPILASILREQIDQAQAVSERAGIPIETINLVLTAQLQAWLEQRLGLDNQSAIERFIHGELAEVCGFLPKARTEEDQLEHIDLVGATWRFECLVAGRYGEALHVSKASEIGASLAMDLRQTGTNRPLNISFSRPMDGERAGLVLRMLLAEARTAQRDYEAERQARATQRIFRVWRGYLRDRADIETKRSNLIRYLDRQVEGGCPARC